MSGAAPGGGKKYEVLASALRQRIADGEFPVASLLPAEADLADDYRVSRWVVREALAQLADEGWIIKWPGKRSEVIRPGRRPVEIGPGAQIRAVMPSARQREQAGSGQGEPLLIVTTAAGSVAYPADSTVLVT
jgi:DNA-binding GntR family transcriptional regulator